jgi:hypothetical protein
MPNPAPYIVMTSIFPPTEAVRKFALIAPGRLLIAGDRKTPPDWDHPGVTFLSASRQESLEYKIAARLPWNHYSRKMVAYLHAIRAGATMIVDTDDDNIPYPYWAVPSFEARNLTTPKSTGFVNAYRWFTDQHIWPRGFPLERIASPASIISESQLADSNTRVGIWQGLADDDPDVDAIYRLTVGNPCIFRRRPPVVLSPGTLCPFNSQNTAFRAEVFPLLYLPAYVTFRFTDILRGLVAQPILWAAGYTLGFHEATVIQARNPHNYLKDFESEIPCYLLPQKIIDVAGSAVSKESSISENLWRVYRALREISVIEDRELPLLQAWIDDLVA